MSNVEKLVAKLRQIQDEINVRYERKDAVVKALLKASREMDAAPAPDAVDRVLTMEPFED